jgi:ADP-L-glycero-D-manno-heptose 6-epimerase
MKTHRHERSRTPIKGKSRKGRASRYVVTGGAGFVGSNLAAALTARDPDAEIIVIDDFRSGSFANLVEAFARKGLAPFSGIVLPLPAEDLEFDELLSSTQVDAVFHLGAITDTTEADQVEMLAVNTVPMIGIMSACVGAGVPLVYASSAAVYGTPPQAKERRPFPLDAAGTPSNVYGFSKWLMECEHRRFVAPATANPPHIVGLRYFNVFGPGESRKGKMASMVYQLARKMLAGEAPRLFRDGSHARDQVYVDDVVACTMAAAGLGDKPAPTPGVYNVGSGVATSFNAMIDAIRAALGLKPGELPTDYFDMPRDIRAFYQDYTCADLSATKAGLGWTPAHDPVAAIRTYASMLREGTRSYG